MKRIMRITAEKISVNQFDQCHQCSNKNMK
jgi:hypothetical protein